jgi:hypothetical protein
LTTVLADPEVGEDMILESTVNRVGAAGKSLPGCPVTVTPTAPPAQEFALTLKYAVSCPVEVLTEQLTKSIPSESAAEVMVQVLSTLKKPVPVTVTCVAGVAGVPGALIGGYPLKALNVTAG